MRPRRNLSRLLAAGGALALILAACASQDDATTAPAPPDDSASEAPEAEDAEEPDATPDGDFPARPIDLVNPWSPGGAHDAHIRVISAVLPDYLGERVMTSVRDGGSGTIGLHYVANAPADGYTMVLGDPTSAILMPLRDDVGYTHEDFRAVAQINEAAVVFLTHPDSPWETIDDFIEDARANPGQYSYGGIPGSFFHLNNLMLEDDADIDLRMVPYEGGAAPYQALLAGDVDVVHAFPAVVADDLRAGVVRGLAITGDERLDAAPEMPTFAELGYDVGLAYFRPLLVPRDTPDAVVAVLESAIAEMVEDPAFVRLITGLGESVNFLGSDAATEVLMSEGESMRRVVQDLLG